MGALYIVYSHGCGCQLPVASYGSFLDNRVFIGYLVGKKEEMKGRERKRVLICPNGKLSFIS